MYGQDEEIKMKLMNDTAQQTAYGLGLQGSAGKSCDPPTRENLLQRFRSRLNRARRDKIKTEQLEELTYLLDKHPEVARILDLVDAIGGE